MVDGFYRIPAATEVRDIHKLKSKLSGYSFGG